MSNVINRKELVYTAVHTLAEVGYAAIFAALNETLPNPPRVESGAVTREAWIRSYILEAAKKDNVKIADLPVREKKANVEKPEKAIGVKAKAPKLVAAVAGSLADKPKVTDMTVEEIADKAAKRSKKKSKATGSGATPTTEGVENFDPAEARAYVDAVTDDIENFRAPSELSMEEVKALI